jgi:hypothetical protein
MGGPLDVTQSIGMIVFQLMPSASGWTLAREWMTAVGTLGAFGVALFLVGIGQRDRRHERERLRTAQAARISISEPRLTGPLIPTPEGTEHTFTVKVRNRSDGTITDVSFGMRLNPQEEGEHGRFMSGQRWNDVKRIDPGETVKRTWIVAIPAAANPARGGHITLHNPTSYLLFEDAAGRRWERDEYHHLNPR